MWSNDYLVIQRTGYRKHGISTTDTCCAGTRILSDVCFVGKIM